MTTARRVQTLLLLLFLFLFSLPALAQGEQGQPVTLADTHHPALLLKTNQPGLYLEAATVRSEISLQIRGIIARGLVRQSFENTSSRCVEAIYVFPLAENATVDAMRLKVGVRTMEGAIKEREEATREYTQARSEGRRASLLEQHRPNLFTVSVASLGANESADVEIEFQQIVNFDGQYSLRIPLAIAPRYTPLDAGASQTALPPIRHEHRSAKRNPVKLEIDLDSGIPLATIASPTHALEPMTLSATRTKLTPRDVEIASDRDFELVWVPQLGAAPQSTAFTETVDGYRYTLLMLFPPDLAARPAVVLPRETVFIIDTSGSMGGPSIEQAKQALLTALRRLRSSDTFNVIEFNDTARSLFESSRLADGVAVDEALRWVDALVANGGTEMLGALQLALGDDSSTDRVRQVVFITDGQVGNEQQIFEFIRQHVGSTRLFTVAIGAAPNSFFMRNAARSGRGTFTHIGDVGEVEQKMTAMFRKLESPVLSNLAVRVDRAAEIWPASIPDLYAGEPLIVTMRAPIAGETRTRGRITGTSFEQAFTAADVEMPAGVARLWARQKIDALRDSIFTGASADDVRKQIVALGIEHHIVTEHTSLVAVDTTPSGVDAQSCTSELVPINVPVGWGGAEGALPQTATPAALLMIVGSALLMLAVAARRIW